MGTAILAKTFAAAWGADDAAYAAGLWHDLGKYATEFQDMIRQDDAEAHLEDVKNPSKKRVDHSTAGALWALQNDPTGRPSFYGRMLSYVIAGHHAGLADWNMSDQGHGGLKQRLEDGSHLTRAMTANPPQEIMKPAVGVSKPSETTDFALWTRMLASALFDADFLDTEAFFDPSRSHQRQGYPSLQALADSLHTHLYQFASAPKSQVNKVRADVLSACKSAAPSQPGLFSLTVPTGGGKTLSSLAFAINHALIHGKQRIIYAIPFTSIIEQTAEVFRNALGEGAVLEHHSSLDFDGQTAQARLASENWDAPVIVTTTVQLFESLFASRTSKLRKIHNLANSVIILDEAQTLPPHVLRPIIAIVDQLVRNFGCTIVLCTATQPTLKTVFQGLAEPREIVPEPERHFSALDRVRVDFSRLNNPVSLESLASDIRSHHQALVIVNTRKDCRALHALLSDRNPYHLSTWQCAAHRSDLLTEIKAKITAGESVTVISTSLIEAGVDISFPVAYRALAGLDSIAQAAGRCNRNGELTGKGTVQVFEFEKSKPYGHTAQTSEAARYCLARHQNHPFRLEAFRTFFDQLFWAKGSAALDRHGIMNLLKMRTEPKKALTADQFEFAFRSAANAFQMIEDQQHSLVVPYANAETIITALRFAGPSMGIHRRLQRFTVSVRGKDMNELNKLGAVESIHGVDVLNTTRLYDNTYGLKFGTFSDDDLMF